MRWFLVQVQALTKLHNGQIALPVRICVSFKYPHDVCIDKDENIYVAQWNSGNTYPYKIRTGMIRILELVFIYASFVSAVKSTPTYIRGFNTVQLSQRHLINSSLTFCKLKTIKIEAPYLDAGLKILEVHSIEGNENELFLIQRRTSH